MERRVYKISLAKPIVLPLSGRDARSKAEIDAYVEKAIKEGTAERLESNPYDIPHDITPKRFRGKVSVQVRSDGAGVIELHNPSKRAQLAAKVLRRPKPEPRVRAYSMPPHSQIHIGTYTHALRPSLRFGIDVLDPDTVGVAKRVETVIIYRDFPTGETENPPITPSPQLGVPTG